MSATNEHSQTKRQKCRPQGGRVHARTIISTGESMADETKKETVTLEELMVSKLAMSDDTVKLLIEKGVFY